MKETITMELKKTPNPYNLIRTLAHYVITYAIYKSVNDNDKAQHSDEILEQIVGMILESESCAMKRARREE